MANVKTKQSVFNHFHLPAETDGKFKAQCKHCCSEISDSKKINSNFLTHLNVKHTLLLTFLVSLDLKIVKFMDVKKQVLRTYSKNLVNNLNILVQDF